MERRLRDAGGDLPMTPTTIRAGRPGALAFTLGTLVTEWSQHAAMLESFDRHGFAAADCEVLAIDNSGAGQTGAYAGLNAILNAARGRIVILCHQDVRLSEEGRGQLELRLAELDTRDPRWAVAGNAGATALGRLAMRITDPHGCDRRLGDLPARVMSLDENLLIVKREARVGFSRDLDGFHLYGADICLMAELAGCSAWVIDFHLEHLSPGRKSADFHAGERAFKAKWNHALRPRWLQTTCTLLHVGGGAARAVATALARRPLAGLARRLPGALGWTGKRAAR